LPFQSIYGRKLIAVIDLETLQWTVLEFAAKLWINDMRLFNGKDLIIETEKTSSDGSVKPLLQFYKFSVW
jgi:hypothetical protein